MSPTLRWIIRVTLCCVFLSSCRAPTPPSSHKHTLRMNIKREPSTLDPRRGGEVISSAMHFILYEGLMRRNPDSSLALAQAKAVEISEDGKTYTFHLRETKWSDGSPVTAFDFEYAWKTLLTPQFPAPNAHLLYPIKNAEGAKKGTFSLDLVGIHVLDEKTLQVVLENPTPYFLDLISFCVFFPIPHRLDQAQPNWMQEAGPHFVSNGPFKLAQWKHHDEICFEKNWSYWECDQIDLDEIYVSMVADEGTALQMYENNELDIIGLGHSPLPNDPLTQYRQKGLLKIYPIPGTSVLCFNIDRFPFTNENIRKAFSYAIHRKEIVENITQLGEEVATSLIPPLLRNTPDLSYFQDHDVKKARRCFLQGLKELGITAQQFPNVTYEYSHSDLNHKLAQVLQQQWVQTLGVEVRLQKNEHRVLFDRLGNRNFMMAQCFWQAQYNDPMSILERFKYKANAKNYSGWQHPLYIHLLEAAAQQTCAEKRSHYLQAAEALCIEEMPLTPLFHWKTAWMIKDHLAYPEVHPKGTLDFTRIYFKKS